MNVVSVMAHQDDELMCLGTMLKMQERGDSLHFVCLTDGCGGMVQWPDMNREEAAAIRCREMSALAEAVGATYQCLGEQDEYLYDTPEVRLNLINALRICKADVVFTHFNPDYNVDHTTTNVLVRQCAMHTPFPMTHTDAPPLTVCPAVFLVEPLGAFEFEPSHWVDITAQMDRKAELSLYHQSQDGAFRAAFGTGLDHWIRKTSVNRGEQSGVAYAEAFRPMLSRGLIKPYPILP
ncbi:MAG: PIG-L family deacetylase [Armatimonadota bacterium]